MNIAFHLTSAFSRWTRLVQPPTAVLLKSLRLAVAALVGMSGLACLAQQYAQSTVTKIKNGGGYVYLATDGSGNIIVTSYVGYLQPNNASYKETPNGTGDYTETVLPVTGYGFGNVAADTSGNLYFNSETGGVISGTGIDVFSASGSTYAATGGVSGSGEGPIAVDSHGDIFVLQNTSGNNYGTYDDYGGQIVELTPSGGGNYSRTTVVPTGGFTGTGIGLGVDAAGNFYYVDSLATGSTIYKQTLAGGAFTRSTVGTIPVAATTLTVDTAGDVFVAATDGRIYKETLANGIYTESVVLSEFYSVQSMVGLPDGSIALYAGFNGIVVKETPLPTATSPAFAFAATQVAGTASSATVAFTFQTAGALAASPYAISTADYTAAATQPAGACVSGHDYAVGSTCSIAINFAATAPGARAGGITLNGSNGLTLGTAALNGIGISPEAVVYPGVASALITGFPQQLAGMALDAAGNFYLADSLNNRVLKETLQGGAYAQTVVTTDLNSVSSVTVDGAGNLYIADSGYKRVLKETPSNGSYIESNLITGYLADNRTQPYRTAVDASGDVFILLATGNGANQFLLKETPGMGLYNETVVNAYPNVGYGGQYLRYIAADGQGNVYATGASPAVILKETLANGVYAESQISSTYGYELAADNTGNVFVGNGLMMEIPYTGGTYGAAFHIPGLYDGNGASLALDASDNIYLTRRESDGSYGVDQIDTHHTAPVIFGSAAVGTSVNATSFDVIVSNAGNSPLVLASPSTGVNPIFSSANFSSGSDTTCPTATTSSTASLPPGATCVQGFKFTPKRSGSISDTLTFADNSLNATASTPVIVLGGTGTGGLSISPTSIVFPSTQTGTVSAVITATLTNSSAQSVTLTPGTLTDGTDFTSTDNCSGAVAGNSACIVSFTFTPASAGTLNSTFTIGDANTGGANVSVTLSGPATAPAVVSATLSPTSYNYGFVTPNAVSPTAQKIFTLTNTGNTTLTNTIAVTGANATAFTFVGNTCGSTLAAGANCILTVQFNPPSAGAYSATLAVSSVSGSTTLNESAALTGNGAGMLSIAPVSQVFANTAVGGTGAAQASTISNATGQAVYLSSGSLTDAADFTQSDNCNGLVAAGGTCTVSFTFTPKAAGSLASTYAIHDLNHPGTPLNVALSGNATATLVPQAVLSPTALTFSSVPGTQPYNQTLTLSNPGTGPLTIASVLLSGANAATFSIVTNACGANLKAGSACTISLGCTAIATGTYTATLTVTDNAAPATQSAALTCTISGTPQASLTPTAVSFGNINVGAKSTASTLTLTNAGTATLGINSISLGGANAASYAITTNACGLTLAAGTSCAVTVTFLPTGAGSAAATLTVIDAVGAQTSALSGIGVAAATTSDFTIAATPAQTAYHGTTVNYTVQLASLLASSPFGNAATLSATGMPAGVTVSFAPATLVPGAATATTSVMTVTIPPLSAALHPSDGPSPWSRGSGLGGGATVLSAIAICFVRRRKARAWQRLLTTVLLLSGAASAAVLSGCGANNGFGVPTTTSVLTVTATSGTTVHSTQVTLTIQ